MIVERIIARIDEIFPSEKRLVRVTMDRETMAKPHQKTVTEEGESVGISLPQGENLFPGAVIYEDDERIVYVDLVEEDGLVIYPKGSMQWARAAYNIGNMHQPAYIREDRIVAPYDEILASLMTKLDISWERMDCVIDGTRASVQAGHGHGHEHGHSHSHSHEHAHSHSHSHEHEHAHEHGGPGHEG